MNKALRFARENEPELMAKREEMVAEINRLRAENYYALYQSFYEAELQRQNRVETPRTRQHDHAKAQLLLLQQRMQDRLLENPSRHHSKELIYPDLCAYVEHLNTGHFDRIEKLDYLGQLQLQLQALSTQGAEIYEELEQLQQQIMARQEVLTVPPLKSTPEKKPDRDDDFSPGF